MKMESSDSDCPLTVSSFYKYALIENPAELRKEHFEFCKSLNLTGRILVGKEGINGSVCGTKESVEEYKTFLKNNSLFHDMGFKDGISIKPAFRKLFVRLRKEIVHFGFKVDLCKTAEFISPKELKEMLDNKEDITLLDVRNDYETKVGKFRNAVSLGMKNFRDLPGHLDKISCLKEKKIITYCTGGIRCEKATAYLAENGFNNVQQLQGGILNFGNEFPDTYWEGLCFVFDDRLAVPINSNNNHDNTLVKCEWCTSINGGYLNCHNISCDKLFIACDNCIQKHKASCSQYCENSHNRRKKGAMK